MAAFAQTTNFLVSIQRVMEIWNNTTNEIMIQQIMVLIDTEFAAMASGSAGETYTVTTGLEAILEEKLNNMSNNTQRLAMQDFIQALLVEFALVETNGLLYTVGATVVRGLREAVYNMPNTTHRIGLDQIIDIISTELDALETASA